MVINHLLTGMILQVDDSHARQNHPSQFQGTNKFVPLDTICRATNYSTPLASRVSWQRLGPQPKQHLFKVRSWKLDVFFPFWSWLVLGA